jgi:hypothetical protein
MQMKRETQNNEKKGEFVSEKSSIPMFDPPNLRKCHSQQAFAPLV